ncbi:MAG TPA: hypothetical protein VGA98_02625 [Allosphingosinicella sp.]|jgi:hypothetical protein
MPDDFQSAWDKHAAIMDAAVDSRLADRISYSQAGGPFAMVRGYVIDVTEALTDDESFDEELGERKRVKVAKALVPVVSMAGDRLRHPRLGPGTFRPVGSHPSDQGRYWIFDVQQATT